MEPEFKPNDMRVIWFVRDQCDRWPARAKLAYLMLYSRMAADRWVWPSKQRLAADMSAKKDTAIAAIRDLERMHLFEEKQATFHPETKAQGTNRYRLLPPWAATYKLCPQYAPAETGINFVNPREWEISTGGSEKPTGGESELSTGGVEKNDAPGRSNRHEVIPMKLNREAGANAAPPTADRLATEIHKELREQLGSRAGNRLTLLRVLDLLKQHGKTQLRFAGARVAEERCALKDAGKPTLDDPLKFFYGILRTSDEDEAKAYFEEKAARPDPGRDPHLVSDGPPDDQEDEISRRIRVQNEKLRQAAAAREETPRGRIRKQDADYLARQAGQHQVLGPRPKSTDEQD